jgi:hypothetical protein
MNPRRLSALAVLLTLAGLAALAPAASATPAAATTAAAPKVVIFNMYPSPLVQPKRVFFQANSGPYLDKLTWPTWGAATTTGTGAYTLDCTNGGSACGADTGLTTYPARYVLSDLGPCPRVGANVQSYRQGYVEIDRNGGTDHVDFASDYDFCAKPPTLQAAKAAVTKHVVKKLHAVKPKVTCKLEPVDQIDVDCFARWTNKDGKAVKHEFEVSNRSGNGLTVFELGVG